MSVTITRSLGQTVGGLMCGGSCCCVAYGVYWRESIIPFVVASAAAGLGFWLINRLYLNDPEAREEYIWEVKRQPLKDSLRKFGGRTVCQLIDLSDARSLFHRDFPVATTPLSRVVRELGMNKVEEECLTTGIVTSAELRDHFLVDIKQVQKSGSSHQFSLLWRRFPNEGLERLFRITSTDSQVLVALLWVEFGCYQDTSFVPSSSSQARASAPPSGTSSIMSVDKDSTYDTVVEIASFCVKFLHVDKQFFRNTLERCPMSYRPFTELLDHHLFTLFQRGLVDSAFCAQKLHNEVDSNPLLRVWDVESRVPLSKLIPSGIVPSPNVWKRLFSSSVPTNPFLSSHLTKENSIVDFLEYFEPLLIKYGKDLLSESLWPHVVFVKSQWEDSKRRVEVEFPFPSAPKKGSKESPEMMALRAKKRREIEERREAFLLSEKRRIHEAFARRHSHVDSASSCPLM